MTKKIYINPGHSDKDPGAVGYETERKLNVAVSKHMNEYLLANYVCETKITPGTMDSLTAICNDANSWGADLFVSNHFNAGGGDGYEALVYSQKRVALGEIFAKHVKAAGQNLRLYGAAPGVKIRTDLDVLAKTNMPAVANEGAFVDNLKDIQDWNDDAELKKLGEAYAKAAAEFLGLEKKVQQKSVYHVHYSAKIGPFNDKKTAENLVVALKTAGCVDVGVTESKG
ncbi:MAG: N-acetylmuramoyl-L-alanine amidase [Oscillospiraceae bacterium]|nr:N-acetylmuramoyl-L-alanine amidase [Oscillospiraceae bacterium]